MMEWSYQNQTFTSSNIGDYVGFVYKITNSITGRMYIGKKFFWSTTRKKPLKGKVRKRVTRKESNWKDYYGSCKPLLEEIEKYGKQIYNREILSLHKTKGQVNFNETRLLFGHDVLKSEKYYNENIMGRWFKENTTG